MKNPITHGDMKRATASHLRRERRKDAGDAFARRLMKYAAFHTSPGVGETDQNLLRRRRDFNRRGNVAVRLDDESAGPCLDGLQRELAVHTARGEDVGHRDRV